MKAVEVKQSFNKVQAVKKRCNEFSKNDKFFTKTKIVFFREKFLIRNVATNWIKVKSKRIANKSVEGEIEVINLI